MTCISLEEEILVSISWFLLWGFCHQHRKWSKWRDNFVCPKQTQGTICSQLIFAKPYKKFAFYLTSEQDYTLTKNHSTLCTKYNHSIYLFSHINISTDYPPELWLKLILIYAKHGGLILGTFTSRISLHFTKFYQRGPHIQDQRLADHWYC